VETIENAVARDATANTDRDRDIADASRNLRAVFAGVWLCLVTIIAGTVISLSAVISPSGRWMMPLGRLWSRLVLGAAGVRVRYEGLEHASGREPRIFMANHLSTLDVPAIAMALPNNNRFLAQWAFKWIPFFGWAMLSTGGCIFVRAGHRKNVTESLRRCSERIRRGDCVLVFPEGARSLDGRLQEFKRGVFRLALAARVPVVPVVITGVHELMPPRAFQIRSGSARVRFGQPIAVDESTTIAGLANEVRAAMVRELAARRVA
jgi:1-acyl-sn-glycerol-3-phosphate acyltransferase